METTETNAIPPSRPQRLMRGMGWAMLASSSLLLFTLMKLPDERIKDFLQNSWRPALAAQGINVDSDRASLSIIPLAYTLEGATVTMQNSPPARFERISLSPSLIQMALGKLAGVAKLTQPRKGTLRIGGSVPRSGKAMTGDADLSLEDFDAGEAGLLSYLVPNLKGSALISGTGALSGDFNLPNTWSGNMNLALKKIQLPAQMVFLNLPDIAVAEGKVDVTIDKGKLTLKKATLGKKGSADDVVLDVTGDIALNRYLPMSALNLRANVGLSEKVKKAFSFLDAMIGQAKQPDGSYSFKITGTIGEPASVPASPGQ